MPTPLHGAATEALSRWRPPTHAQAALREATLGFLLAREDACRRSCLPGHLTAGALVMTPDAGAVCFVHHRLVDAWLQPGGHLEEGDRDLAAAALREAQEETGLVDLRLDPEPLHLDVHPITCRGSGPTRHYDVRFLAVAERTDPVVSQESHDVRWFDVDALPDVFDEVRDLVAAGVRRLGHA